MDRKKTIYKYNQLSNRKFYRIYFLILSFRKPKSPRDLQEKWKNLASLPTNLKLDAILYQKIISIYRFFADDLFDLFTRISS